MALTEKSTLVDAPSYSTVSKYELKVGTKVNSNTLVVNDKADEYKGKIDACYRNLKKLFDSVALEYEKCAKESVKGDTIVASLKKVAANCKEQGEYCLKRRTQLDNLYTKAKSKKYTNELEETIRFMDARISDLEERLTAVDGKKNRVISYIVEGESYAKGLDSLVKK